MIDRIFFAALTFCLLIAGTLAIGAAMLGVDQRSVAARGVPATIRVVQLEPVVITAKRLAPNTVVAQTGSAEHAASRVQ